MPPKAYQIRRWTFDVQLFFKSIAWIFNPRDLTGIIADFAVLIAGTFTLLVHLNDPVTSLGLGAV